MVSTIVEQPQTAVQTPRQEVVYRAPVTGKICRAVVLHAGDTMLKVQGADYGGDPRWIGRDDVISYVAPNYPTDAPPTPQAVAQTAPEMPILPGPRVFAPENFIILPPMEADPRFAYNVARARLNELYNEWQDEREYHGMVLATFHSDTAEQRARLSRYEARYRQQLVTVAQAKSRLTPAHLAWYQEEAHRLAAASFFHITADEQLIADEAV